MGRLLLVDDDPVMILDQVTHALGPQGLRIDVARTAEEGLRQVAAQLTDVILLDVHLPGGINKTAEAKLVQFVADGSPKDKALDRRVRETVHAIMCMPEYQLA